MARDVCGVLVLVGLILVQLALSATYLFLFIKYRDIPVEACHRPLDKYCFAASVVIILTAIFTVIYGCSSSQRLVKWTYNFCVVATVLVWILGLFMLIDTFVNGKVRYSFRDNCVPELFEASICFYLLPIVFAIYFAFVRCLRRVCSCGERRALADQDESANL